MEKLGKKQNLKNIAMNLIAFATQFLISFYISPIIVSKTGASAYGFLGLANDFVSYASIIATVFNSVAARFIANAYYKKEFEKANCYFNSLIVANFFIAGVLGIGGILLVPNLDSLLSIPLELIFDVKLTFVLIFSSYIVSLVTLVFTTATFVTNRTDIQGFRNIIQYITRFAIIVIFLNFVSVHIYWVALATLIASIVVAVMNVRLTSRLTPEITVGLKYAKKQYAIELAKSGCWMAITSISTILLRGLDLTIANIFIGDYEMGLLSIARTMPNNVTSVISTIAPIFTPAFIVLYANHDKRGIINNINDSVKSMAIILFVPVTGFIVFSYDFYSLWQKSLSEEELIIVTALSIITVIQAYFNSTTSTLAQISLVTNKLKMPVFVSLGCGIISIIAEIVLIKTTKLGLYAIVLSTTVVMIIRYIFFNSAYAAWCLREPMSCFFSCVLKKYICIPVLFAFMLSVRKLMPISGWGDFIIDVGICGFAGYGFMLVIYERKFIKSYLGKFFNKSR